MWIKNTYDIFTNSLKRERLGGKIRYYSILYNLKSFARGSNDTDRSHWASSLYILLLTIWLRIQFPALACLYFLCEFCLKCGHSSLLRGTGNLFNWEIIANWRPGLANRLLVSNQLCGRHRWTMVNVQKSVNQTIVLYLLQFKELGSSSRFRNYV